MRRLTVAFVPRPLRPMFEHSTSGPPHSVLIAILGAGASGLGIAIRLQQAGLGDFVLLDRGDTIGGTWRDNTYPGAACDVPSHLYSYSFAPNPAWTHQFARQPEIRAYLEQCADDYGLRDRILLRTAVTELRYHEPSARWHIHTRGGQRLIARYVINAIGALRDPRYPDLPGRDRFEGPALHSARWDHNVDLRGRHIGVVGTGASAIQVVPELAKLAQTLTVFQRTPAWVLPRRDRPYSPARRRLFARFPSTMRLHRWRIYWRLESRFPLVFGRRTSFSSAIEWLLRRQIRKTFPDPATADALIPRYRIGCKRILTSDGWYPALSRAHVAVESTPIDHLTARGLVLKDGRSIALDAIVYCTGFRVDQPLAKMKVYGREGVELSEWWNDRPRAYLGMTIPRFPNIFSLLGPNSALGHNSVLLMLEAQIEYILQAIRYVQRRTDLTSIEIKESVLEQWLEQIDQTHADRVWGSGCQSWYLDRNGSNFTLWPGSTIEYIGRTRRFDPTIYRQQWVAPKQPPKGQGV